MLYWKLTKLVCLISIAVSVTVLSFRLIMLVMFELMPEVNPTNLPIDSTEGAFLFQTRKCQFNNCYLTDRSRLMPDFTSFHVVLLDSPDIQYFENSRKFPRKSTRCQKYVFFSGDLAAAFSVHTMWNDYFKLFWKYFVIRNKQEKIMGPQKKINRLKVIHMNPVDSNFIIELQTKTNIVDKVKNYLSLYKIKVDIYGNCGYHFYLKSDIDKCLGMLAKEYFNLGLEIAMSNDYVSDIILHALQHVTVPAVYGGANYTRFRFLPGGSYLNALQHDPEMLVCRMLEIMQNPSFSQMFFTWRNHYSYHAHSDSPETANDCRLCKLMNDEDRYFMNALRVNFTGWWIPEGKCKNLLV